MRRVSTMIFATALCALAAAALAAPAKAEFGFESFDVTYTDELGDPITQAGATPHSQTTSFSFNTRDHSVHGEVPDELVKDQVIFQVEGLAGDPNAVPACSVLDFLYRDDGLVGGQCPDEAQVGEGTFQIGPPGPENPPYSTRVYLLEPAPGAAARIGFWIATVPVTAQLTVNPDPPHNIVATVKNTPQTAPLFNAEVTLWGVPASDAHDAARGGPSSVDPSAFIIMPRSCEGPLVSAYAITSWLNPTTVVTGSASSPAMEDCPALEFSPEVSAAPTTNRAASPSGFDFGIEIDDPGLLDPDQRAGSDLKQAVVTLPEGFTVNPASAGGLEACSQAQLARETYDSRFGEGCPAASRVASVEVTTPLLDEQLRGSIFVATPHANPFGELLAGYMVIKERERGIAIRLPGKFETDPNTGQITASFDQNPQLPFSKLEVSFFGGARGSLSTPDLCGEYEVTTELRPWSGAAPDISTQPITIAQGPGGGPCPTSQAALPHEPAFEAGTLSPLAGRHSPLVVNLGRPDGSQRFSDLTLSPPPGLVAKLAGTPFCPEAALAAAAERSGRSEQADPSCPAASRVGTVHAAAGAGPSPYWVRGTAYLAGPYKGAPLSMAIVTPAVAGPFDLGTIVVESALFVDPRTAKITAVSDPIPRILEGIPLQLREVSVRLDKPDFARTGTSCEPMSFDGELTSTLGVLAELRSRFQLGGCAELGFGPRFGFRALGPRATRPNGHPGLLATVDFAEDETTEANVKSASVVLPRRMIVDQNNIATTCTRAQFAQRQCPDETIVGEAEAHTPLLDDPVQGNVHLLASENPLPDMVADLRGLVDVELHGRIHAQGIRVRNTFDVVPDAPVESFELRLQGGPDGILVNGANLCKRARFRRVDIQIEAHNGARADQRRFIQSRACDRQRARSLARRAKTLRQKARRAARNGNRARAKKLRQRANRLQNRARNIRQRLGGGS